MAPTEQIIWEAKQNPGTLRGSRRASTVIDASGCKVTRGFLLPSRSSSRSSSASSHDNDLPCVPASPLEEASPGFCRPTGSLYHAPEIAILRSDSESALHKPTQTGIFHRPPQLGGRSHTFHGRRASCWHGLASDSTALPASAMRRTKSDYTGLISMQTPAMIKIDTQTLGDAQESCVIGDELGEENAIASDSDEEDEEGDFSTAPSFRRRSGIAVQRSRPTYAQRRAMCDQRVERQEFLPPLPCIQPVPQATGMMVSTAARFVSTVYERDIETPIEIKSFAYEEVVPHHDLRPSRSRPRPKKGVLKNADSRSSSEESVKHVNTAIKRESAPVVHDKLVPDPTSEVE